MRAGCGRRGDFMDRVPGMFGPGHKGNGKKTLWPESEWGRWALAYTLLFIICCLGVYAPFYLLGRSFIWQTDGWMQHYKALLFYSDWLKGIWKELWENHRLAVPNFSFGLGGGSDVITTLHYYVIGDPFAFFSVFVPAEHMERFYGGMILLRLYLSGIAFGGFCFQTGRRGVCAVLAGALSYVFCGFALYAAVRHPYFAMPLLCLPLLLIGVERILQKKGWLFLTLSVFLSAVSNFYFFYMLVLLTVVYVALRLFFELRRQPRQALWMLGRIAFFSVLGVLLSGFLLLPVLQGFLSDARMTVSYDVSLLYPLEHYCRLFSLFLSRGNSYWMCMAFSVPCLPAVILLFSKRGSKGVLKALFVTGVVFLAFPIFGHILNGFSYVSNRWCFAFAMLTAYILTAEWEELMRAGRKEVFLLFAVCCVYFGLCVFLEKSRGTQPYFAIALLFVLLFFLLWQADAEPQRARWTGWVCLAVLVCNVIANGYWLNGPAAGNYASDFIETKDVEAKQEANTGVAVETVAKKDGVSAFYRYSGRSLTKNASILGGPYSTQYYWSLSDPAMVAFRREMNLLEYRDYDYVGYDDRTALNALDSVLYYAVPSGSTRCIPYGFSYQETVDVRQEENDAAQEALKKELGTEELTQEQQAVIDGALRSAYAVYRNEYALPLGYVYHSYFLQDKWRELSSVEKQETLLQTAVLEEAAKGLPEEAPVLTSVSLPFEIQGSSRNVTWEDGAFVTTADNVSVSLLFTGMEDSETYVCLRGLTFTGTSAYDLYYGGDRVDPGQLYNRVNWELLSSEKQESIRRSALYWTQPDTVGISFRASSGASKTLSYHTQEYSWFNDRHDFDVNLGYAQDPVSEVVITFPSAGVYSYDSLEIVCQPMGRYTQQVLKLRQEGLENVRVGTDAVTGEITLETPGLMCLSVPYRKGWRAFVDGTETEPVRTNGVYLGIALEKGAHSIRLEYATPLWKEGLLLSIVGLGIVLALRAVRYQ